MNSGDSNLVKQIEVNKLEEARPILEEIYCIWDEFGIAGDRKAKRAEELWVNVIQLLKDVLEEEKCSKAEIESNIRQNLTAVEQLSSELDEPVFQVEGTVMEQYEALKTEIDRLQKMKAERLQAYNNLRNEEQRLCAILSFPQYEDLSRPIPSDDDMKELQQHMDTLQAEMQVRENEMSKLRNELQNIEQEIGLSRNDFTTGHPKSLSNGAFANMKEVLGEAKQKQNEQRIRKQQLQDRLEALYNRLKIDQINRKKFPGININALQSIEAEIEKLKEIQRENMQKIVIEVKTELLQFWDKCSVPAAERESFQPYSTTEISDLVLEQLEKELNKWKKYYSLTEQIIVKIQRRENMWKEQMELEAQASNPNRFKDRKYNLLKEERERNRLQKLFPKIENEIIQEIGHFEAETGTSFQYNGEDYCIYMKNQWAELKKQKGEEQNTKLRKDKMQLDTKVTFGTPAADTLRPLPRTAPSKLAIPRNFYSRLPETSPNNASTSDVRS